MKINCDASTCIYHDGACTCNADQIHVGCKKDCSCTQALCSTFQPKDNCSRE